MSNWLGRVILFAIVGLGGIFSLQYTTGHFKPERQLILLNRTRPDFHDFINIEKQSTAILSKDSLKGYFDYFHLVTEAMPDNSDGILMLGYLNAITGNQAQAAILFKEAYRLDPPFFFTGYNLALVYYEQGAYSQSIDLLQKILVVAPGITLNRMMSSVIYRQILSSINDSGDIIGGLRQAYHDADVLLIDSLEKQKKLQGENLAAPEVHAHIM